MMEQLRFIEALLADERADGITLSELKAFLAAIEDLIPEPKEMTEEEIRKQIL